MLRASSTQGGWQHFYVNERNACVVWFPDGGPLNPQFYGVINGGLGVFYGINGVVLMECHASPSHVWATELNVNLG